MEREGGRETRHTQVQRRGVEGGRERDRQTETERQRERERTRTRKLYFTRIVV